MRVEIRQSTPHPCGSPILGAEGLMHDQPTLPGMRLELDTPMSIHPEALGCVAMITGWACSCFLETPR